MLGHLVHAPQVTIAYGAHDVATCHALAGAHVDLRVGVEHGVVAVALGGRVGEAVEQLARHLLARGEQLAQAAGVAQVTEQDRAGQAPPIVHQ